MQSPTAAQAAELLNACSALWLATLSLMTAFMQQPAPAHRYLLARRIARNLGTLREQECFDAGTRAKFAKLATSWEGKTRALAPVQDARPGVLARLQRLLAG